MPLEAVHITITPILQVKLEAILHRQQVLSNLIVIFLIVCLLLVKDALDAAVAACDNEGDEGEDELEPLELAGN